MNGSDLLHLTAVSRLLHVFAFHLCGTGCFMDTDPPLGAFKIESKLKVASLIPVRATESFVSIST